MSRHWWFKALLLTLTVLVVGCSDKDGVMECEQTTAPIDSIGPVAQAQFWGDRIVSEAFYALNRSRSGGSNVSYHGCAMSDWNYVESDEEADKRVAYEIGGCVNRGGARGTVSFRDWDGGVDVCHRGGYCKYFADLVLYRSSYGWGGGQHLILPGGFYYATRNVHEAAPGWIIQRSSSPHTAIVVSRYLR